MQHALFLAFRQHHPLHLFARLREDRLHEQVGFVDELRQLLDVGVEVFDRARRHAGVHRRLGHRRRDLDDQARIERFRNDVFRAEGEILVIIGGSHHVALLRQRQIGDGMHAGQFHLFVDSGGAHVQRAAENEREAQDVVHLVRVVGTAGTDDGVRAHRFGQRRQNFRFRVGQRHDQRIARHGFHHILRQDARAGAAEEDVGVRDGVAQRALTVILDGVGGFGLLHVSVAAFIDDAFGIADGDVLLTQPQRHQQVQTGDRGRTGAGHHQPYVGDVLLHHAQAVEHRRSGDDRRAMLVVVEHRDLHALTQFLFDVETLRRLDVFQVDTAEGRFQRGNNVD